MDNVAFDENLVVDASALASQPIQTREDALTLARELLGLHRSCGAHFVQLEIWGVVPVPLRWALDQLCGPGLNEYNGSVWIYESFNVQRSVEGGKPTFQHAGWLLTQAWND